MPKNILNLLNDQKIKQLPTGPKETAYSDGGGLYLVVRPYGGKEFVFRYTSPITKKRRKIGIGSYTHIKLQLARQKATEFRTILSNHQDPLEFRAEKITAEQERMRQKQFNTLNAFNEWQKYALKNRKDAGAEIERAFKADVFPVIGKTPVREVGRNDIKTILERLTKRKANRMANRLLSDLRQFFSYLETEELIEKNPTKGLKKEHFGGIEKPRTRRLSTEELVLLKEKMPNSGLEPRYQCAVWLLLATALRVNELSCLRWDEIDYNNNTLFIPANKVKTSQAHTVYLSDFALEKFKQLENTKSGSYVFMSSKTDNTYIHRQTITKQIVDRQNNEPIKKRSSLNNSLVLPNGRWTSHDLRRTAASVMQELGVLPQIIERCLNHKEKSRMIATYQQGILEKEERKAFEILGVQLQFIIGS